MTVTLLMVYIVILGLMTLTLFQGHSCVRNINCKLHVWEYCPHLLNVVQLLHALERLCTVYVWLLCVLKGHNMFLFSQARWKLYIWIYSDTINVINVRLCMVVLFIELYLFIPLWVALTIFQGHSNVKQFYLKIMCSCPVKWKLCSMVSVK